MIYFGKLDGIHFGLMPMQGLTPMQFTGFQDSKGKEVYEGDILKSPLGNIVRVLFGTKTYKTKILPLPGDDLIQFHGWIVENKGGLTECLDASFLGGEIIGNIYQNPELMQ